MVEAEFLECAAQFHALGARLSAAIGSDTSGRLAVGVLPDVLAAVRQGELASCRLIERADRTGEYGADGAASTAAFVRQVSGERSQWAARRVALGRALADRMPATLKGWQAGDLGLDHADVILRATKNLSDPQLAAGVETFLADQAPQLTPTQLAAAADHLLASAAPDETDAETARKYAAQHVNLSQTIGGMWRLNGWLDPEAGLIFSRALAAFTRKPDPDAGDLLSESIGHRRAEALVQLCRHASTHAESCNGEGGSRHSVIVGIDHQHLQDGLAAAGIDGGATLPAAAARRIACDAGLLPAVYGSDSELLDIGRRSRSIRTALRYALIARDGGCIFSGCDRPPSWTEAHHRRHYANGGVTSKNNLDLLCVRHHHLVHEGGWILTIGTDPDRTPWFHPPDGRSPIAGQRRRLIPGHQNLRSTVRSTVGRGEGPCRT